ncbi:uncharacterized protein VTP21DRAFT_3422 [Calcarisporiella thermophila]|uniref:uncharacterized protein n=1 Tax=Calcarisporiella thermophila TaxID=911321 RepID=UPI003743142D
MERSSELPPGVPDLIPHDLGPIDVVTKIYVFLNVTTIICGLVVVSIIIFLGRFDKKLISRVSLRLTAAISIVDACNAAINLLYATALPVSPFVCQFAAWAVVFTNLAYIFLTAAIAVNLQLLVLHENRFRPSLEVAYWTVSLGMSLLLSLLPWFAGRYGYDEAQATCWFKESYTIPSRIWEAVCMIVWVLGLIIYCTIVVFLVNIKLHRHKKRFLASKNINPMLRQRQTLLNKLIARIGLYAVIPLITHLGICMYELNIIINLRIEMWMGFWSAIGISSTGIWNLAAFLCDPAIHNAFDTIAYKTVLKYHKHELPGPFLQWMVRRLLVPRYPIPSSYVHNLLQSHRQSLSGKRAHRPSLEGSLPEENQCPPYQLYQQLMADFGQFDGERMRASSPPSSQQQTEEWKYSRRIALRRDSEGDSIDDDELREGTFIQYQDGVVTHVTPVLPSTEEPMHSGMIGSPSRVNSIVNDNLRYNAYLVIRGL